MKKNEGILRNFLFLNPIAGKFIRFIKFFLVDVVTYLDNATVPLFGESDLIVVLEKSSDLFCEAAKYVSSLKMVSVKMIQEQFKIGNASSEKLLEQLAQAGFVEPDNGLEDRKVNQSAIFLMLSRLLCSDVQREGVKLNPDLASRLFCYVPVHNNRDGIHRWGIVNFV